MRLVAANPQNKCCPWPLNRSRDRSPPGDEFEGLDRSLEQDAESEIAYFVNQPTETANHTPFGQSCSPLRAQQEGKITERTGQPSRALEVIGQRDPPGNFKERVKPMFELSHLRSLDFQPGLLAIEAVEDADRERENCSRAKMPGRKKNGRSPGNNICQRG